ncbi:MAG: hypothetical protein ACF8SC_07470 [Phycisphaerales bacterium JB037]
MKRRDRSGSLTRRRGYVLPIVLLLTLVCTLAATVMLNRQNAQTAAVRRQIDHYQEHHGSRGIEEVIAAWVETLEVNELPAIIAEDPKVLDMTLADGSVASVFLSDGQSRALASFSGVDASGATDGPAIYEILQALVPMDEIASVTRDAGPVAISVQGADPRVLTAAMRYVTGDENTAEELTREILRRREREDLTTTGLTAIATRARLPQEQRGVFNRVLVAEPSIFEMRVELRSASGPGGGGVLVSAYRGLLRVETGSSGSAAGRTAILEFEPVELEPGGAG